MVAYTTLAWLLFFADAQDVASMNPLQSLRVSFSAWAKNGRRIGMAK